MSQPLRSAPQRAPSAGAVFTQALPAGTVLGAYRIVSVLGAGGFGITYLATDTDVGMDMAVKEFLPSAIAARNADGAVQPHSPVQAADYEWGLARFRDEAKTLARLDHPNIVRVRDFREANRTAYVVMEFIAGETLEARLQRTNTLPAGELARLLPALWSGVEAVHEAGFLHRDLKPSNIMLRPDGTPVLIDFGAARQALSAHSRSLTAVLSEGYAPYEQYQRDGDQGAWTDVYALGATLYRCVTGEKPVEATRRIDARVKGKPDPLVPARELAAGRYPAPLLAAIDRALATVETERPRSIAEFRAIAESPVPESAPPAATLVLGASSAPREAASGATLLAGLPAPHAGGETLVAGAPPAHVVPRIGARRSLLRWAVLTAGIVLLSGGAVAGYVVLRDRQAAVEEAQRVEQAEKQRRVAEEERRAAEEARRRAAERAAAAAEAEAKAAAVRDLEAGMAASRAKQFDEALKLLVKAIETGKLTAAQHAQALLAKSAAWAGKGDFVRALAEADAAVRVDPKSVEALLDRGRIRWHRQQQDAALADFNQALKLDPKSAEAYSLRGIVWFHRRDYDRAIADCTEALRLKPGLADARFNRGLAWQAKGDRAKAIEDFRAALRANPPEELARNVRRILESLGVQP